MIKELPISLQPDVRLGWSLNQNIYIILNEQAAYFGKSNWNIADIQLIPLDPVTCVWNFFFFESILCGKFVNC